MDSEEDGGDEDTGGTVVLVSRSQEGNEGDNQIGFVLDSIVDSSQSLLDMGNSSTPASGLRHNETMGE